MSFDRCEICGANHWSEVYGGAVRDGVFGSSREQASVARCAGCGVDRLAEECATPESVYETEAYRKKLQQGLDSESYFRLLDELQIHTLQALWPTSLRGCVIAARRANPESMPSALSPTIYGAAILNNPVRRIVSTCPYSPAP
jgi:hypothetical protein